MSSQSAVCVDAVAVPSRAAANASGGAYDIREQPLAPVAPRDDLVPWQKDVVDVVVRKRARAGRLALRPEEARAAVARSHPRDPRRDAPGHRTARRGRTTCNHQKREVCFAVHHVRHDAARRKRENCEKFDSSPADKQAAQHAHTDKNNPHTRGRRSAGLDKALPREPCPDGSR